MRTPSTPRPPRPPHIGIFDSGIGGLSVLRALRCHVPLAQISYIADARFTPWGDRPTEWVQARAVQLGAWLLGGGADLVLVACNTATTQAISTLRQRWPDTAFVGVEPGIKPAVAASRNGRVAVMATSGTLQSPRVARLVAQHAGGAAVLRLPCPGLVEAIERAGPDDTRLHALLDRIAADLQAAQVDTVALACTHYPLVADALQARLGPEVQLVDTADAVARQVARLLAQHTRQDALGACRTWGVDSEKRPQRGQFLPDLQAHSSPMGQKAGKKWTAEAVSQPTFPKPDRLLAPPARHAEQQVGQPPCSPAPTTAALLPRLLSTGNPALLQQAARRWLQPDALAEALRLPDL